MQQTQPTQTTRRAKTQGWKRCLSILALRVLRWVETGLNWLHSVLLKSCKFPVAPNASTRRCMWWKC